MNVTAAHNPSDNFDQAGWRITNPELPFEPEPQTPAAVAAAGAKAHHVFLHRLARQTGEHADHQLEIDIQVPPGRRSLNEYEIRFSVLRSVFSRRGVSLSRAALEELVPRFKFKNDERPLLQRVNYAGIVKGAYLVRLSSDTEAKILAWRTEAEQLTAAKTPPIHGSTGAQRYARALQIALDCYIQPSLNAEIRALMTPANLAGIAATLTTKGTPIGWALTAAAALTLGAEGTQALTDFKNFVMYAGFAEKPTDLDLAARSLASVVARVGAHGLSTMIGGAVKPMRA